MTTDTSSIYLSGLERHGVPYSDELGRVFVSLPERLPFEELDESIMHVCKGEERLFDLAIIYYGGMYRNAVDLWPIIAQAQEDPIIDPSIPLAVGEVIMIPSISYIEMTAFGTPLTEYPRL
jgi:hypothetical protein